MFETILVPTDGSADAAVAADHAIDVAATYGATVHALFVVDVGDLGLRTGTNAPLSKVDEPLRELGEEATASVVERAGERGVEATAAIRIGVPAEAILNYVEEAGIDLVVMGTHGRSGLSRFLLGSVAERVVRHSPVPVLTVRERGAERDDGSERERKRRRT